MAAQPEPLSNYVISQLNEGKRKEQIETDLLAKGHDERFVKDLVRESQKLRYAKRRTQGLVLILAGAVVCFASFLLTITSSFSQESFTTILFGLTSIGIVIVFAGFTRVF